MNRPRSAGRLSVVATALEAGCATLWSEDMHLGLVVDERLTILNPFVDDEPGSP